MRDLPMPAGRLRAILDALGYSRVFNAIAAATSLEAAGIGVSVETFIKTLTGVDRGALPEVQRTETIREIIGKHLGPHLAIAPTPRYEAVVNETVRAILKALEG